MQILSHKKPGIIGQNQILSIVKSTRKMYANDQPGIMLSISNHPSIHVKLTYSIAYELV